jgi:hypothetical protein
VGGRAAANSALVAARATTLGAVTQARRCMKGALEADHRQAAELQTEAAEVAQRSTTAVRPRP